MRGLVWMKDEGAEYAEVDLSSGLTAVGVAIGTDPVPYRLEYSLRTSAEYVTELLTVRAHGAGWARALDLRRGTDGIWSCETKCEGELEGPEPGGDMAGLNDALDCDLALSPLTNTMPVLRHGLLRSQGRMGFVMALVQVPQLHVVHHPQSYTHLGPDSVRYESEGFSADLVCDDDGIVTDYPGLARLAVR
ncbi:putative glycolipid-binding domain-containing protein [Planomonospora algeriensis]